MIYGLICLYLCYSTLFEIIERVGKNFIFLWCCVCYIAVMNYTSNYTQIKSFFCLKIDKAIIFLLVGFSAFCFTGTYLLINSHNDFFSSESIINWIKTCIWIYPVLIHFISILTKMHLDVNPPNIRWWVYIMGIIGILVPCFIFLIAFNPAITSPDSISCFEMAYTVGNIEILNWHPPFYIIILSLLIKICNSISFLIVVQDFFFAFVFMEGIAFLRRVGVPKKNVILLYVFVATNYSNIMQLVTLWKDIPFMTSMLWLTIVLCKVAIDERKCLKDYKWYIEFFFSIVFTCFFRQNGILPALAVILLFPLFCSMKKRTVAVAVVSLSMICIINGPVYKHYKVVQVPGLKYFALANDILYSYYNCEERDDSVVKMVEEITNNTPENFEYNVYYTKYNGGALGDYSVKSFLQIYISNFFKHIRPTIYAFLARNEYLWSISSPSVMNENCVNYYGQGPEFASANIPERKSNALTCVFSKKTDEWTKMPLVYIIYWKVGLYNLIILICLVITIVKNGKGCLKPLLPFVPIVFNCLALCVSSGWPDYRYYWPSMIVGLFLMIITPALKKESEGAPMSLN